MTARAEKLTTGMSELANAAGIPLQGYRAGTMFSIFFTETAVRDWSTAKTSDTTRFGRYFQGMLERGVYLAPSQFEAGFISAAHNEGVVEETLNAAEAVFKTL
jgi:glutamate-1-semialdehyde 2,1-aminomutase